MARWHRVGEAFELTKIANDAVIDLGWTWRIECDQGQYRQVRVIVAAPCSDSAAPRTDSRETIRIRGERAIDAVLGQEEPPSLIVVPAD